VPLLGVLLAQLSLCRRFVREIYEMRKEDEHRFHRHPKKADTPA
jgi:hypothetical protein